MFSTIWIWAFKCKHSNLKHLNLMVWNVWKEPYCTLRIKYTLMYTLFMRLLKCRLKTLHATQTYPWTQKQQLALTMTGLIHRSLVRTSEQSQINTTLETNNSCHDEPETPIKTPERHLFHVNTLSERFSVTTWMIFQAAENGEHHILSKTVKHFSVAFTGNIKARIQKASRWWQQR